MARRKQKGSRVPMSTATCPLPKKLLLALTLFSTLFTPSALCPVGDTGLEELGLAAEEPAGDLMDGESGVAIGRSSGVGLLGFGWL